MQSRSKSPVINQLVISLLYTTTLHNIFTLEDFLTSQTNSDSFPIHYTSSLQRQGHYSLIQTFPVSA